MDDNIFTNTKGIKFISDNKNAYYYDNNSGFIYPDKSVPHAVNTQKPEIISLATENDVKNHLALHGYKQLLLEVTQTCNLRCKYCCYSDHYSNTRNHGNKSMPFDIAQKAINHYMENFIKICHKNPLRNPVISFYGGEPLVNFALIKEVIHYMADNYPSYKPDYNITTNALLLSKEIADILVDNNFSIVVSLDGDKENHDRNRVKINGEGSFNEVFGNINRLRKDYPDYKKLGLSVCFDYNTDLQRLSTFIKENNLFVIIINMVSHQETDYYKKFTAEDIDQFVERMAILKQQYLKLAKEDGILLAEKSLLLSLFGFGYLDFACHPVLNEERPKYMPYTGSCIPGDKIYVTVNGDFHMCEKISPYFPIGNVIKGLHIKNIVKYINKINEFQQKCNHCPISRLCDICIARATDKDQIVLPATYCSDRYQYVKKTLMEYVNLMEANPKQLENVVMSYYSDVRVKTGKIFD